MSKKFNKGNKKMNQTCLVFVDKDLDGSVLFLIIFFREIKGKIGRGIKKKNLITSINNCNRRK